MSLRVPGGGGGGRSSTLRPEGQPGQQSQRSCFGYWRHRASRNSEESDSDSETALDPELPRCDRRAREPVGRSPAGGPVPFAPATARPARAPGRALPPLARAGSHASPHPGALRPVPRPPRAPATPSAPPSLRALRPAATCCGPAGARR